MAGITNLNQKAGSELGCTNRHTAYPAVLCRRHPNGASRPGTHTVGPAGSQRSPQLRSVLHCSGRGRIVHAGTDVSQNFRLGPMSDRNCDDSHAGEYRHDMDRKINMRTKMSVYSLRSACTQNRSRRGEPNALSQLKGFCRPTSLKSLKSL